MHIKSQTITLDRSLTPASFRYLDVPAVQTADVRLDGDGSNGSNVGVHSFQNAVPAMAFTGGLSSADEVGCCAEKANTLVVSGSAPFSPINGSFNGLHPKSDFSAIIKPMKPQIKKNL
jgi:hypothetical protein